MTDFFRFPHTPHLAWLGPGTPREDKVLSSAEAEALLAHPVVIEEKVDGANLGLSIDENGQVVMQNRGSYILPSQLPPQFKPLARWLAEHRFAFLDHLPPELILFGEWCFARHSVPYTQLPDWFLAFDVFDRTKQKFWSTRRRNVLADQLGIALVPRIAAGRFSLADVRTFLGQSKLGDEPAEGLYIRHETDEWLLARAKLVRPEFAQAIGEHWTKRKLEANALFRD